MLPRAHCALVGSSTNLIVGKRLNDQIDRADVVIRVNRIVTVFVYLNTVEHGGRTRWRWLNHDACDGGGAGAAFYVSPRPGSGRTDIIGGSGPELSVSPEEGLAVVHFPSTLPEYGGVTDYNVWHEACAPTSLPTRSLPFGRRANCSERFPRCPRKGEAAGDEKWIAQQFIWSHPGLNFRRVLDRENWEPSRRRCPANL